MENKSTLKYYVVGAIVLIVIVIAVLLLVGKSKPAQPQPESANTATPDANTPAAAASNAVTPVSTPEPAVSTPTPSVSTPNTPDISSPAPVTGEPAVPGVNGPASAGSAPGTAAAGLIGTWDSSVQGKGMQGSGKLTLNGILYQLSLTGDVNLVIQKVENNTATGTITFKNACINGTKSVAGKPATAFSPQCEKTYSRPADMQIDGNKISWSGKGDLGADITMTGTYSSDTMSGTFTRTSSSGNIDGTFNLTRSKN